MFEKYTYNYLMENALNNAPEEIDTRPGSIYYDAVSGVMLEIARMYSDLDVVLNLSSVDSAVGEYLDRKTSEYGITRREASCARYKITFVGTTPKTRTRFFAGSLYFILEDSNGVLNIKCETPGTIANNILPGTAAVPVNTISGLESATIGEIYEQGLDVETDDALRARLREKIAGPAENGNRQHYKTWCESVEGVGKARIFPLWNGPNTVKGVLISALGTPVGDRVVKAVQDYIDPATSENKTIVDGVEYVVGDGLGNGVANIGAHFTAVSAKTLNLGISFSAQLKTGAVVATVKENVKNAITEYFKKLVMENAAENIVIRVSAIGSVLLNISDIIDYSGLLINGEAKNIVPDSDCVPILGEVEISVL